MLVELNYKKEGKKKGGGEEKEKEKKRGKEEGGKERESTKREPVKNYKRELKCHLTYTALPHYC
jgi:hypothetical protein